MKKRITVISANIGGFDEPKHFPIQNIECDCLYFNEDNLPIPMASLDNRMKAKYFKLQAHKLFPDNDYIIWMDSSFQIQSSDFVEYMIERLFPPFHIAVTKHPDRNCIYEESKFVTKLLFQGDKYILNRYANSQIEKEAEHYYNMGYPANNGLYACGLFARKVNPEVNSFFDKWWDACMQWSCFDQLSFPVLAKQCGIKINPLVFDNYLDNKFYKIIKHIKVS